MKTYEKPMIMIMPLEGNEQLCGSCADNGGMTLNPVNGNPGMIFSVDFSGGNQDGRLTYEEVKPMFGSGEMCEKKIDMYCKFTSSGQKVAWS